MNPSPIPSPRVKFAQSLWRLSRITSMAFTMQIDRFQFEDELRKGVSGKRVLITGAGKDGGLGQAFALSAGLNGAAVVGVHFHRSYVDGFDLVYALRNE